MLKKAVSGRPQLKAHGLANRKTLTLQDSMLSLFPLSQTTGGLRFRKKSLVTVGSTGYTIVRPGWGRPNGVR